MKLCCFLSTFLYFMILNKVCYKLIITLSGDLLINLYSCAE